MRALEVFGAAVKFWMKRYTVDLSDVQRQAGDPPRRRFLLGAWRAEE